MEVALTVTKLASKFLSILSLLLMLGRQRLLFLLVELIGVIICLQVLNHQSQSFFKESRQEGRIKENATFELLKRYEI